MNFVEHIYHFQLIQFFHNHFLGKDELDKTNYYIITTGKNVLKTIKFCLLRERCEIRVDVVYMVVFCLWCDCCFLSLLCITFMVRFLFSRHITQCSAQNNYSHNELALGMFVLNCFWDVFIVKELCDILHPQCINLSFTAL